MAAVAPSPAQPPRELSRPASASSSRRASEGKSEEKPSAATINVVDVSEEQKATDDKSPKKEDSKSPKAPTRPPIRPSLPSKFDLELNPFEQSFRASSHHDSTGSLSDREKSSKRNSPPRGGDETSTKHNALPPLSSLTSPAAADPSQFPWLASQSLRTGPLSPAMLAGPQGQQGNNRNGENGANNGNGNGEHQAFDSSQFRTGFTPGTGSGFTPGYNSLMNGSNFSNLPLPSPNTAAFLNMVTNATPLGEGEQGGAPSNDQSNNGGDAQQQPPHHAPSGLPPHMQPQHGGMGPYSQQGEQQDTITPGTFSALTGAINDMNRANSNGHHVQQGPPPPPHHGMPPHQPPYYNMNGPAPHHQMQQHHSNGPPGMPPHGHPPHHIDYAQQSANAASQAANGLFLLSQAHQELSKREEEGRGSTPLMNKRTSVGAVPPGSGKGPQASGSAPAPSTATAAAGQKRKSDAGNVGASAPAAKGKKGKKAAAAAAAAATGPSPTVKKDESTSPSFSGVMDDDDDDGEPRMVNGKPETEEDKRKNFLERNRQAALKCRQRKKAWLTELQQKVDSLSTENEALQRTIGGLHDEVGRLTALLMQRDGAMGVQPYGRPIR